jgi:hypothetical protein
MGGLQAILQKADWTWFCQFAAADRWIKAMLVSGIQVLVLVLHTS